MRFASRLCLLSLLGAFSACGDDSKDDGGEEPDTDAELLADVNAHMAECGIADPQLASSIEDSVDRCIAGCFIKAPCDQILAFYCSEEQSALVQCGVACLTEMPLTDGFDCGGGEQAPHLFVCDGEDDCANGKDEQGCADYTCKDGEKLPPPIDIECDGYADCGDGSDEDGCPNLCGE